MPFYTILTYIGVKLDRSLVPSSHLANAQKTKITRRSVEATSKVRMDANVKTLQIVDLSLVYSTCEYCAPVWCHSVHTRLIDSVLNDAMRIVTACLRATPTDYLPFLVCIQPAELRRQGATLSLAYRSLMDPKHPLHQLVVGPTTVHEERP